MTLAGVGNLGLTDDAFSLEAHPILPEVEMINEA